MPCAHFVTKVLETRETPDGQTRRRRHCTCCGLNFSTVGSGVREQLMVPHIKDDAEQINAKQRARRIARAAKALEPA